MFALTISYTVLKQVEQFIQFDWNLVCIFKYLNYIYFNSNPPVFQLIDVANNFFLFSLKSNLTLSITSLKAKAYTCCIVYPLLKKKNVSKSEIIIQFSKNNQKWKKIILITARSKAPPLCALFGCLPTPLRDEWWCTHRDDDAPTEIWDPRPFRMLDPPLSSHLHRTYLFRRHFRDTTKANLIVPRTHKSHTDTSSFSCNFSAPE